MKNTTIRVTLALITTLLLLFIISCSKKEKVKPEPLESKVATQAITTINELKDAYESMDMSKAQKFTTNQGFKNFQDSIKEFQSVDLEFTPKWVDISDGTIKVYIAWNGTWSHSGTKSTENGLAVFTLKGNPPVVDEILRTNPFAQH
ncbi:MAG: hypothetical protein L3V56_08525 [Candidatus Magnetoovum sp. WYHC-5]|nr:hypothetical protein [Candidatus Magnetoovum sp. WYHC-5]